MIKKIAFTIVLFSLLLAACAPAATLNSRAPSPGVVTGMQSNESISQAPAAEAPALPSLADKSAYSLDQTSTSADRLVIKNAALAMAVNDPQKSMVNITRMAEAMGGFVVSADMYQQTLNNGSQVPQVNMSIRVPAEKLAEALATIKGETTQPIISETESSQDVTAEYTDLNSRLVNLQAAEKQLQQIMDSAVKTEDVLSVYSQLVSVREQIELIKGQMKYYEQSAALSSISIQLLANAAVQPVTIAGWQPVGVAKEALQTLINALQSLANLGIRLAILYVPLLLIIFVPIALIIWGIVALVRKIRRPKVVASPAPE
jgi:hypothetical protein